MWDIGLMPLTSSSSPWPQSGPTIGFPPAILVLSPSISPETNLTKKSMSAFQYRKNLQLLPKCDPEMKSKDDKETEKKQTKRSKESIELVQVSLSLINSLWKITAYSRTFSAQINNCLTCSYLQEPVSISASLMLC